MIFADLHCHPSFKPYGQSFTEGNDRDLPQPGDKVSLWHTSKETALDTKLSAMLGAAMYTQGSLASAVAGGVQVMCVSVGALEKEFITVAGAVPDAVITAISVAAGGANVENFLCDVVTRCGATRLTNVRSTKDYFSDMKGEIDFIRGQADTVVPIAVKDPTNPAATHTKYCKFIIARNGAMVADTLAHNTRPGAGSSEADPLILALVLTIEGMHNLDAMHDEDTVMDKLNRIKSGEAGDIFYVTFCHHFWNGLCGHAPSLIGTMGTIFDQREHCSEGFNALGLKVVKGLLDKANGGRRVLIDTKHMSFTSRGQYYNLLNGVIPAEIPLTTEERKELTDFFRFNANPGAANPFPPVIVSHAAVNGYYSKDGAGIRYRGNFPYHSAAGVLNPFENPVAYPDASINLYDTDILQVAKYEGIIGIQLDERRITGPAGLEVAKKQPEDLRHAYLVWNQVLHIIEYCDSMGYKNVWDRVCIGSDFDGIICPMDRLHRIDDYPELRVGLMHFCKLYLMPTGEFSARQETAAMAKRGTIANRFQDAVWKPGRTRLDLASPNAPEQTGMTAEDIIEKICYKNALDFMVKWFV